MGTISGESTATVALPIAQVWQLVVDVEDAPRWQEGLSALKVTERGPDGMPTRVDVEVDAKVRKLHATMSVEAQPPQRLALSQIKGDLKSIQTGWELTAIDDSQTAIRYYADVDLGRLGLVIRGPVVELLRHQLAGVRAGELARALSR